MIGHGESAVQDDAEVADSVRHRDATNVAATKCLLLKQLTGSEAHNVRLRRVEPQSTATQPGVDVIQTR